MRGSDARARVLLTGATGFVGRHCVEPLARYGYEIHGIRTSPAGNAPGGETVRWHTADLLRGGAASVMERVRPTHLLHLAWTTAPGSYWTSSDNVAWVRASLELFETFCRFGGRRAVVAGTCAEYGGSNEAMRENETPLVPASLYGAAKQALRIAVESVAWRTGTSVAWARLFFLYGPHEKPERLIPSVVRALLREETARCTHGAQVRDYLHVRDAGAALAALVDGTVSGAVNVASGEPVTVREIVVGIAERMQRRDLLRLGAIAAPDDEPSRIVADTRLLGEGLLWSPRIALEEGLEDVISWWRQREGRASRESSR